MNINIRELKDTRALIAVMYQENPTWEYLRKSLIEIEASKQQNPLELENYNTNCLYYGNMCIYDADKELQVNLKHEFIYDKQLRLNLSSLLPSEISNVVIIGMWRHYVCEDTFPTNINRILEQVGAIGPRIQIDSKLLK